MEKKELKVRINIPEGVDIKAEGNIIEISGEEIKIGVEYINKDREKDKKELGVSRNGRLYLNG